MGRFEEADKKLKFADYLINRSYAEPQPRAATQHILRAANLIVLELTNLEENRFGPQVVANKLKKLDKAEAQDFSKFYLQLWQLTSAPKLSKEQVRTALKKVKDFLVWAERESVI